MPVLRPSRPVYRTLLLSLLALCLAIPAFGQGLPVARPESVGVSSERLERVRAAMRSLVDRGELTGVVTLIARDGKVVLLDTQGVSSRDAKTPMRPDTRFRIASMTKPVTSVAVMMLYEQGKLLLTDPVSKFLPEFKDVKVAVIKPGENGGAATMTLEPARRAITIYDLLTHRSGLTYGLFDRGPVGEAYRKAQVSDGLGGDITLAENVARIAAQPLVFQPGARWNYGLSTDVLGRVVEVVSGQSLDRFFRERIFTPLRMLDTGFLVPSDKAAQMAVIYNSSGPNVFTPIPGMQPPLADGPNAVRAPLFSGGAGLVSTAGDYARFCQMLLSGGELDGVRLLGPKTIQLMTVSHTGDLSPSPVGEDSGFGLGFAVVTDLGRSATLGSEGAYSWGGYFGTSFWVDPKERLVVVSMLQQLGVRPNVGDQLKALVYQAITR